MKTLLLVLLLSSTALAQRGAAGTRAAAPTKGAAGTRAVVATQFYNRCSSADTTCATVLQVQPYADGGVVTGANECTGAAVTGDYNEPVPLTRATSGSYCSRSDGGLQWLDAGQPAASGGAIRVRPAITNYRTQSETLGSWGLDNVTVTSDAVTAPNGTATADVMRDNAVNGFHDVYHFIAAAATNRVVSTYAKAGEKTWIGLDHTAGATAADTAFFDLTNCVVGTKGANVSTSAATAVGDGWCRVQAYRTSSTNYTAIYAANSDGVFSYIGDGGSVSIWGGQSETGVPTASDYCGPVEATAVTCDAETCPVANPLLSLNPSAWCIGAKVTPPSAWANLASGQGIGNIGATAAANNSASLSMQTTTGKPLFVVYDTSGGTKQMLVDSAITAAAHTVYGCVNSGTLTIWVDDAKPAQTGSGAGTGIITTQPTSAAIGSLGSANQFGGAVSNFKILRRGTP